MFRKVKDVLKGRKALIVQAIQRGETQRALALLVQGGNNAVDFLEYAWLAARKGNRAIIDFLWKNGLDIRLKDEKGKTLLMEAIEENSVDLVKDLVQKGANVCGGDNNGKTPLMYAAHQGNVDMLRFLVEHGAHISDQDNRECGALMYAAKEGHTAAVEYLCQEGAEVDERTSDVPGQNPFAWTPLMYAVYYGHADTAQCLIDHQADINIVDSLRVGENSYILRTPLMLAAKNKDFKMVSLLCSKGAIPDYDWASDSALTYAIQGGDLEIVKYLCEHKAQIDSKKSGKTPLMWAVLYNRVDIVEYLYNQGADLKLTCSDKGWTALDYAKACKFEEISDFLEDPEGFQKARQSREVGRLLREITYDRLTDETKNKAIIKDLINQNLLDHIFQDKTIDSYDKLKNVYRAVIPLVPNERLLKERIRRSFTQKQQTLTKGSLPRKGEKLKHTQTDPKRQDKGVLNKILFSSLTGGQRR